MNIRINLARFLIKTGRFIQSAAVVIMCPDDLVEFSRRYYFKPNIVQDWSSDQLLKSGLSAQEKYLLDKIKIKKGRLLLLGVGGGREAIPLAKMGFEVTGVDYIPQMVERAKENAEKNGVKISGVFQEISELDQPENSFEIVWLCAAMYSCVPTRKRRIAMLKRIHKVLKPGGYFISGFLWNPQKNVSSKNVFLKKILAWISLGNREYERGDNLRFNNEFIHTFTSLDELKAEIIEGGFKLIDFQVTEGSEFGGAIVKKSN